MNDAHDNAADDKEMLRRSLAQSDFNSVGDFHHKFGLTSVTHSLPHPHKLPVELLLFRYKFMREELEEFLEAYIKGDLPKQADALVDLVYVVLGTAHLMGLPWHELFEEVQRANMAKERAKADGSNSTRGSSFDVVKPPGWTPPDIEDVLLRNGWDGRG